MILHASLVLLILLPTFCVLWSIVAITTTTNPLLPAGNDGVLVAMITGCVTFFVYRTMLIKTSALLQKKIPTNFFKNGYFSTARLCVKIDPVDVSF